jgi:HPt (histidine-containing phosphotransfer) domain-containing protein
MLERNFKLIILELQIILEKAKDKGLSERNREEVRNWLERIEEALNRIKEAYGVKKENLNIFSNKLTARITDDLNMRG